MARPAASPGTAGGGLRRALLYERGAASLRPLTPGGPRSTSASLPWRGCLVERHHGRDLTVHEGFPLATLLVMHLGTALTLEWEQDGVGRCVDLPAGSLSLIPARLLYSARLPGDADFLALALDDSLLAGRAQPLISLDASTFDAVLGFGDPLVRESMLALEREMLDGAAGSTLLAESVTVTVVARLLRRFGRAAGALEPAPVALSQAQLGDAVEFIEGTLDRRVTLRQIADAVALSPFHFARSFRRATGLSPYQFVLRRRVERASDLLLRGFDISAAAAACGFADQSHLTTHFKRRWGITPRVFQRQQRPAAQS
ncbi:MAG: helix-turn-helix domain-containing protein [Limisphaerales bacterium]